MGYTLWFGKYKGVSLEEIALGKTIPGGKSEGYYYFNQLANGDPKYFSYFQNNLRAMQRWSEIHAKLNRFKSPYPCAVCGKNTPTRISIAGSGQWGYSVGRSYITCEDENCQQSMCSMPSSGTGLYPLGFDTGLQFGWSSGGAKYDQKRILEVIREVAGWTASRITEKNATEFIDGITLR